MNPNSEGTFSMPSSHTLDALVVAFDDDPRSLTPAWR